MAEEIKQETEKKQESNFLRLDVNPAGKRMNQLDNGDYQYFCPRGLTIDGKDLTGFNTYLKASRLKDPRVGENAPDFVVKKFNNGIKEVYFPKKFENGKVYTVQLSRKDKETGVIDKVEISAEKFVPAVIEQIKANTKYARENSKEKKQEKIADAPAHDSIESNKSVATGAHAAGPDKNLEQR